MGYMFSNCSKITELPEKSKWDMKNVKDVSHMFQNCELLSSLPDLSIWNVCNVETTREIFHNCKSLLIFPNLYKWNTKNNKIDNTFKNKSYSHRECYTCLREAFNDFHFICNHVCYLGFLIFSIVSLFILCFYPIIPIVISFKLDKANQIIFKSKRLLNATNDYIISIPFNNSNITIINEKNEYHYLKGIIVKLKNSNINEIKSKIKSGQKNMKKVNIVHLVICLIKFLYLSIDFLKI